MDDEKESLDFVVGVGDVFMSWPCVYAGALRVPLITLR